MRMIEWLLTTIFIGLVPSCASAPTVPSPEARQALTPTGKLRVAFLSGTLYGAKDPSTGDYKGQAIELGKGFAGRVNAPFQPIPYSNPAAIIQGAKAGEWDVAFMGINAERAAAIDFSAPYVEVEQGYLVRAGVPIATAAEVDKAGIRIAVIEKGGADVFLSSALKSATLVRTKSVGEIEPLLKADKVDVVAVTKTALFDMAVRFPGSRVLDGRFLVEPLGMGVPKGRNPAAADYVSVFVEEAKATGRVKSAIDGAGLRGVVVAPLK